MTFAGKRDKALVAAVGTPEAGESPGQLPAIQKTAKLPLDEVGITLTFGFYAGLFEEGFEVLSDDVVKSRLFRFAATVLRG